MRAFLLVENAGPWGTDALRDARLPDEVKDGLRARAAAAGVRTLLVRRHRGAPAGPGIRVFAAYADAAAPWMETATLAAPEVLLDLDLEALGRGRSPGLTPTDEPVFCVCTHGRHDACCAELGRPAAAALAAAHPEHSLGGLAHRRRPVRGQPAGAARRPLLRPGRPRPTRPRWPRRTSTGTSTSTCSAAGPGSPSPCRSPRSRVRRETGDTRLDAVRLVALGTHGDDTVVTLDVGDASYDVRVRRTAGERERLTCRATRDSHPTAYEVVALTRR